MLVAVDRWGITMALWFNLEIPIRSASSYISTVHALGCRPWSDNSNLALLYFVWDESTISNDIVGC